MTERFTQLPYPSQRLTRIATMAAVLALTATACSTADKVVIESENQDTRVRMVVIHHTSSDFQDSLNVLTRDSSRPVSSHYLVPEPGDPSYTDKDLKVYELVGEEGRAWHAGYSYWDGKTSLNDMSVGIELVNRTYCHVQQESNDSEREPARICFYPDFAETQMAMLINLLDGILQRHPDVKPNHIIGHSDIAPQRKIDPGPRFPWQRLYQLGYGAWYDDETVIRYWEQFQDGLPSVLTLQTALNTYGYGIELSGEHDKQSQNVVRAFQLHFLPWKVTSEFSVETIAILYALIEKYHPSELEALLADDLVAASDTR